MILTIIFISILISSPLIAYDYYIFQYKYNSRRWIKWGYQWIPYGYVNIKRKIKNHFK